MQRPRLSGDRVDSRWWYWIAAIPAVFGFWLVTVAWVALAIWLEPGLLDTAGGDGPLAQAARISLVAVGVPLVVLTAIFPFAVFQDTQAIDRAGVEWEPPSGTYAAVALVGLLVLAVAGVSDISIGVISGFAVSVPFALYYLQQRHERLGVP
ncbi:hypothetical protein [Halomicrococcus gelatinilyticus]|uniref:hypothetical protein n=1 Tax=Halomicrococcus gelatinilyticus TaxID=1702103 RepID=UPI002E0DDD3B